MTVIIVSINSIIFLVDTVKLCYSMGIMMLYLANRLAKICAHSYKMIRFGPMVLVERNFSPLASNERIVFFQILEGS